MTGRAEQPDLRLAALAVATWMSALGGLHLTAGVGAVIAAGAGALALAGSVYLSRSAPPTVDRYGWVVVVLLLGVVCGGSATAARVGVRDAAPLNELVKAGASVTVGIVVRDDPRTVAAHPGRPAVLLVPGELSWLRASAGSARRISTPARVLVLASHPGWRQLLPGQRLTTTGRLTTPRGGDLTAAVLSTGSAPVLQGRPSVAQRAAGLLRAGLQRACGPLPDEPGGLLPGLVVGDTSRLQPSVDDDFRTTGMTHLTAVSGAIVR